MGLLIVALSLLTGHSLKMKVQEAQELLAPHDVFGGHPTEEYLHGMQMVQSAPDIIHQIAVNSSSAHRRAPLGTRPQVQAVMDEFASKDYMPKKTVQSLLSVLQHEHEDEIKSYSQAIEDIEQANAKSKEGLFEMTESSAQLQGKHDKMKSTEGEVYCAKEHQYCDCNGTVYYGRRHVVDTPTYDNSKPIHTFESMKALDKYATMEVTGSVLCSNSVFGDPDSGFWKSCWCQPPSASAHGDPHVININGERFDLNRGGKMTLLKLPADTAEYVKLDAIVERQHQRLCKHDMYFTQMEVSGSWFNKTIQVSTEKTPNATGGFLFLVTVDGQPFSAKHAKVGIRDLNAFRMTMSSSQQFGTAAWRSTEKLQINAKKIQIEIIQRRGRRRPIGYLDVGVKGLHKLMQSMRVGGLLGEDDHTYWSDSKCTEASFAKQRTGTNEEFITSSASASLGEPLSD